MKVEIKGDKLLKRFFEKASAEIARRRQEIVLRGAEIIRNAIQQQAPKKSGRLAASITAEKEGGGVKVYPKKTHYYAPTVEFGGTHVARERRVRTQKSKGSEEKSDRTSIRRLMAWQENGEWIVAKKVKIKAHPFFYPAAESVKKEFLDFVGKEIWHIFSERYKET